MIVLFQRLYEFLEPQQIPDLSFLVSPPGHVVITKMSKYLLHNIKIRRSGLIADNFPFCNICHNISFTWNIINLDTNIIIKTSHVSTLFNGYNYDNYDYRKIFTLTPASLCGPLICSYCSIFSSKLKPLRKPGDDKSTYRPMMFNYLILIIQ